jgi:hypothetical protein
MEQKNLLIIIAAMAVALALALAVIFVQSQDGPWCNYSTTWDKVTDCYLVEEQCKQKHESGASRGNCVKY